jgi:hypothetical protein
MGSLERYSFPRASRPIDSLSPVLRVVQNGNHGQNALNGVDGDRGTDDGVALSSSQDQRDGSPGTDAGAFLRCSKSAMPSGNL